MKLFRSRVILAASICAAGMLGACQQENDGVPAPQTDVAASDQNARTAVAAGTLIKDGNAALAYSQYPTRLWKETYATDYYEFTYAPQLVTSKGYKNGTLSTDYKYTLDMSGRCVQLVTNWKTYIFEYNACGQLSKWYNKDKPNERGVLTYTADATGWKKSLSVATFYNESGIKTKELKFSYGAAAGLLPDISPLNPEVLPNGVSKYLPIFGVFNTNLVQSLIEDKYDLNGQKSSSTTHLYSYTLNYLGKPLNITAKKVNGTLVSSTDRKYSVPAYSF